MDKRQVLVWCRDSVDRYVARDGSDDVLVYINSI